ncbi:ABC exporter membrane fusion protein [Leptolyngbya sp. NIES-2104]|uniref:ABC exporter membrane fusion protein n=1 Tax=Leptolyngbya sp. NIES-2104 TaxID=1552121 RepID=UPI0006EC6047|nr:ABC exporter membrane fusion protein [Leptolyngbya sp. NIES-2104]GAP96298.1 heterocyst specific ABC-transporter, membrane fusion protein DevB homolog [Leptolyngbya sp. NIES-2104]
MSLDLFLKPKNRLWVVVGLATLVTGGTSFYIVSQFSPKPAAQPVETAPTVKRIAALGRLEPASEVVKLSAPIALDGDRVSQILVKQGDRVQKGQVIAILDSRDKLQDALNQAREQVRVAEAKLAQVRAGAKSGEIEAQQATITRLQADRSGEIAAQAAEINRWEAEVRTAQAEFDRFNKLYQQGAIAASNLDSKRLALDTARSQLRQAQVKQNQAANSLEAQLSEARANLDRIAEVRPVDVEPVETEVRSAIAAMKRAETELEQAYIRAPIAGQILKVHTRAGEKISNSGIADLAQNDQMVAVAEVYQSDIANVKVGQNAVITGQGFEGELQGKVSAVGLLVNQQEVFSNQPGENLDRRVVEVKIRLTPEASQQVSGLTNLQVQTAILLN